MFFSCLDGASFRFFKLPDERGVCHTPLHLPAERRIPTYGYTLYIYRYGPQLSAFSCEGALPPLPHLLFLSCHKKRRQKKVKPSRGLLAA